MLDRQMRRKRIMRAEQTGFPSIDKPWLKYYSEEAINAELPECTILQYIKDKNLKNLSSIALNYFGNEITYRKFLNISKKQQKLFMQWE